MWLCDVLQGPYGKCRWWRNGTGSVGGLGLVSASAYGCYWLVIVSIEYDDFCLFFRAKNRAWGGCLRAQSTMVWKKNPQEAHFRKKQSLPVARFPCLAAAVPYDSAAVVLWSRPNQAMSTSFFLRSQSRPETSKTFFSNEAIPTFLRVGWCATITCLVLLVVTRWHPATDL